MTRLADRTNIKRLRNTPYFEFPKWFAKSDCDSKGGTTVVQHCSIAGMVAKELASRRSILCQILPPGFEFIVAVHDCGKGSPGFQKKCCNKDLESICPELASSDIEANGWEVNHSPIGEAAFRAWAKQERQKNAEWLSWSEVIGGHHGVRKNCFREGCGLYGGDEWAKERHLFLDHLFERFGNSLPDSPPTPETKKLLAGLTCVSDRLK